MVPPPVYPTPARLLRDQSERLSTAAHSESFYMFPLPEDASVATRMCLLRDMLEKYSKKKWEHYCHGCRILCNIHSHVCAVCQTSLRQNTCPGGHGHTYMLAEHFKMNAPEQHMDPRVPN